jgi:hypothetical protein
MVHIVRAFFTVFFSIILTQSISWATRFEVVGYDLNTNLVNYRKIARTKVNSKKRKPGAVKISIHNNVAAQEQLVPANAEVTVPNYPVDSKCPSVNAFRSPDGTMILKYTDLNRLELWDAQGCVVVWIIELEPGFRYATFSPDSKKILAFFEYTFSVWDLDSGALLGNFVQSIMGNKESLITAIAMSHNGKTIAVGSEEGMVSLWDVDGHRLISEFSAHNGRIYFIRFQKDGRKLITYGEHKGMARADVPEIATYKTVEWVLVPQILREPERLLDRDMADYIEVISQYLEEAESKNRRCSYRGLIRYMSNRGQINNKDAKIIESTYFNRLDDDAKAYLNERIPGRPVPKKIAD